MSDLTPEQLSSVAQKLTTAKQKKETGDQAFKNGKTKEALKSYHESLMYLLGIDKNALKSLGVSPQAQPGDAPPDAKEKTEVDEIVEKIYANMSACHLKEGNWKRTVETADKALAKNEDNHKAMYRKGKALGELGYIEKSIRILQDLKSKNPADAPLVDAEVARLTVIDKQREKAQNQKLKGFLTRDKGEKKVAAASATDSPTES